MAKTRKPQQQRSKQTVSDIVEAGLICLRRYGAEGTTTRKIADTAGISVGSLYEYFANKEEVFDAIHHHVVHEIVGMVKPLIPELVKMTPQDAVRALLFAFRDLLRRNDNLYLSYATQMGHFTPRHHLKPLNHVLAELTIQFMMHHPELSRLPNISVMSYIMIHGGVGTVIRHLSERNPAFDFEALTEGLAKMIQYNIEGDLRHETAAGE
ncbi:TetR/AcrR family transcriptional regulator [Ketobacter alkanivorans]|uniref:TetR family transcriptional regulator n=1 Tax=Ketobacter alkanivorans TaxID=1917421 RepID=A0A2K9LUT4_9GAMM|nr:TetR/AcrR family transcriptional regulator [Ketobacter alkanivorans]AUM14604.1 TetR family transcriptional regulator [Ketobacter alkanivorans]